MKKLTVMLAAIVASNVMMAQSVKMPAPSPLQVIKQDFGMASVELTYSRPSLKGRKIIGKQDRWDAIWRVGANAATKLRFNDPVTIGGKLLDTGNYVIYAIPHQKEDWDIIINKGLTNWGTDGYKESEDVVRLKAKMTTNKKQKVETFSMQFDDVKAESMNLVMQWDDWSVSFPITTNVKDRLRAQIETALQGEKKPYQQAANFYYEWDKDYAKALDNVNKAIDARKDGFWLYLLKAKILKDQGNSADAKIAAQKCVELATTAKNDAYIAQGNALLKSLK
jgi:tetratricopeptide (TPR) repeat protein